MKISKTVKDKLEKLERKYAAMGQNMDAYLEGLIYADYPKYWDYIHLDVLLNLQKPKTSFPDEKIFIIYHQITELYFNLILHAIEQINNINTTKDNTDFIKEQLKRINSYWQSLINSFEIMIDGMYKNQFLKFRMSLLPASGFQSAQYGLIEIRSTDLINLIRFNMRNRVSAKDKTENLLQNLYWKQGATELSSGKKTLTLKQFEIKYEEEFQNTALQSRKNNLNKLILTNTKYKKNIDILNLLKTYDFKSNIEWPLMHYKSAVRYLHQKPTDIAATGGTNWQKYLPPKHQRVMFFPTLWSDEELEKWGKNILTTE